jgi:gamma-glutamylcysteine synthetase
MRVDESAPAQRNILRIENEYYKLDPSEASRSSHHRPLGALRLSGAYAVEVRTLDP